MAVTAILERPAFERDLDLRDQIRRAADSMVSNIAEGFAQPTDRALAGYLFHAKGRTPKSEPDSDSRAIVDT